MILRLSKSLMVFTIALFATLVAFGNITDYRTNFLFVQHVFLMDTIYSSSTIKYRAIESPVIHQSCYIIIIGLESLTAFLCWLGGIRMLTNLKADSVEFNKKKNTAIMGLTVGFMTWQVAFVSIGGEWFGMWMSKQWNGLPNAFRFLTMILMVLIFVVQHDKDY